MIFIEDCFRGVARKGCREAMGERRRRPRGRKDREEKRHERDLQQRPASMGDGRRDEQRQERQSSGRGSHSE